MGVKTAGPAEGWEGSQNVTVGERPDPVAGGVAHRPPSPSPSPSRLEPSSLNPEVLSSGLRKRPRKRQEDEPRLGISPAPAAFPSA